MNSVVPSRSAGGDLEENRSSDQTHAFTREAVRGGGGTTGVSAFRPEDAPIRHPPRSNDGAITDVGET